MTMYKRFLIATDGTELSDRALDHGLELAQRCSATVVAVNVVAHYPRSYFDGEALLDMNEAKRSEERWVESAKTLLNAVVTKGKAAGVDISTQLVRSDLIGESILKVAAEQACDLIIMATSGVIRDMLNPEFDLDHSPEAICKELSTIDTAATRAKGITKRLQEMGKARLPQTVPCDLNALAEEVLARLKRVEFKGKHIEVVTEFAADLPQILAEPEPLRQVVGNILVNAADAIADRGTITVSTALQDGMVSITIADTGRGIPAENLQRIFNPFFTTKGGGRGTGLGLSIAASIVKYMGGTIKVNSIPGAGSSFTILLPVK